LDSATTEWSDGTVGPDDLQQLTSRIAELEAERTRLTAMVGILQQTAAAANVADTMVTVTHQLGEAYTLDRSSIILLDEARAARIVATHEDPSVRSLPVDLSRYPEVRRAIESGKTVYLADATAEPMSWMVRETLRRRNVGSAIVVPITLNNNCVGALFLRSRRDRAPVTNEDITFFESVAAILATALAKGQVDAAAASQQAALTATVRRMDAQRIALLAFLERLLGEFKGLEGQAESVAALAPAAGRELDRMVDMVLQKLGKGAKKG
jgi:GAF domain-containing protein